jgi:hypothetical protein
VPIESIVTEEAGYSGLKPSIFQRFSLVRAKRLKDISVSKSLINAKEIN